MMYCAAIAFGMLRLGLWVFESAASTIDVLFVRLYVLGYLLCEMRNAIGAAHGKGTIQHAGDENKPVVRVSGFVCPLLPHVFVGGVRGVVDAGHHCADNDCDQDARDDEEQPNVSQSRKSFVAEENNGTADPGANHVADKDVPWLRFEVDMEQAVHADSLVCDNGGHGGCAEDPGEKVPPASKPAKDASVSTGVYGCPVVY